MNNQSMCNFDVNADASRGVVASKLMLLASAASIAILALPGVAAAQSAAPAPAAPSAPPSSEGATRDSAQSATTSDFEDIVVTARRREENAQRVPISITSLTPDTLRSNNVVAAQDLVQLVPSLSVQTANVGQKESANTSIRGQGYGSTDGSPAVATYLNEVPIPTDFDGGLAGGPGLFFDLENIQVLKGPQGTLFGKNTMGGAILLQSARPKEEFGGRIQVGFGNFNDRQIDGAINIPIVSDKVLARFAFNAEKRDGYTYIQSMPNHLNGFDLDNRNFYSLRGSLTLKPFDGFQNDTIVTYQHYSSHGTGQFLFDILPGDTGDTLYGAAWRQELSRQRQLGARTHIPINTDLNGGGGSLFIAQNISKLNLSSDVALRNIIGYSRARFTYRADLDGSTQPLFDVTAYEASPQQFTEELQLQGNSLGNRLNWVVGGFYANLTPSEANPLPPLGVRVALPLGSSAGSPNVVQTRGQYIRSKAVFGQASYGLGGALEGLKLTAGVRYTWDDKRKITNIIGGPTSDISTSSEAFTYTAGIDYQVSPRTLIYLATRRGYRPGGGTFSSSGKEFLYGPEYLTDYEAGLKTDFKLAGIPVRINAAGYRQDYSKIQVNRLVPEPTEPGGSINVTQNAGSARVWGAELEAVANLTKDLQIGGNFAYLDFQFTNFLSGVDVAAIQQTRTANRVPYSYGLQASYRLPVDASVGEVKLSTNYHWQDKSGDFLGTTTIPAFGLLNMSLDWNKIAGKPIDVQLYVTNLTNRTYYSGGISFLGFVERNYGDPRFYGIRLRYRFGSDGN